jgi:ribosomal protein uL23
MEGKKETIPAKKQKAAVKPKEVKQGAPKKESKPLEQKNGFDPWSILQYPHLAEKSMKSVEIENKLVFIVDRRANKDMIASAVEKEFDVAVVGVNTEITPKGLKKAYVKLSEKFSAGDIATRLGMV